MLVQNCTLTVCLLFTDCLLLDPSLPICSKLRLCLPHRVDSDRGSAKFDSKKKTLSITLPITRDDVLS